MVRTSPAHRSVVRILATLLLGFASLATHAHSLRSPAVVQVERDASFDFEALFRIGRGEERLSQYSVIGIDNVGDVDYDADGECVDLFPEGSEIPIAVSGDLTDPTRTGKLRIRLVTCGISGSQTVFEADVEIFPHRGNTIFWIEAGAIHRASYYGENAREVVAVDEADAAYGYLALDPIDGRVIWTSYESFSAGRRRAGWFGQGIVGFGPGGKNSFGGLAVDLPGRKLYSADPSDCIPLCGSVTRFRTDGTNAQQIISLDLPLALDASAELDTMCWSDGWSEIVQCSDLTGNDIRTVAEDVEVDGVALDSVLDKVFWADRQAGTIHGADTDGANGDVLVDEGLVQPRDLTVDPLGRKIYWSDPGAGRIQRANLDGSDVEDVLTGLNDPMGITLLYGQGLIDLRFDGDLMLWTDLPDVSEYDVVQGNLQTLRTTGGDLAAATRACAANSTAVTELDTSSTPSTTSGTWWLVRGVTTTGNGTYGSGGLTEAADRDEPVSVSGEDCP